MTTVRIPRDAFEASATVGVQLGKHQVVVALTEQGPLAYLDRCPHRGAPMLAGGRIVSGLTPENGRLRSDGSMLHVRCPWHKWDFDMRSGRCAVDPRLRLRTYAAWYDGDEIVVSLERVTGEN